MSHRMLVCAYAHDAIFNTCFSDLDLSTRVTACATVIKLLTCLLFG